MIYPPNLHTFESEWGTKTMTCYLITTPADKNCGRESVLILQALGNYPHQVGGVGGCEKVKTRWQK